VVRSISTLKRIITSSRAVFQNGRITNLIRTPTVLLDHPIQIRKLEFGIIFHLFGLIAGKILKWRKTYKEEIITKKPFCGGGP